MEAMTARLAALAFLPLFAAATAHAQAPGEWTPSEPTAPPATSAPSAPAHRWSVGVAIGSTELAPDGFEDQSATFDGAAIAIRYRGWRHLELELSLGGGRQVLEDGIEGPLAMATGTFAARYRFNPERSWNWWLLAGLGATTVAPHDASDEVIEAAQRPHVAIGVGLEKRWNRFALQLELRALGVGQTEEEMQLTRDGAMVSSGLSGGNASLGASYYF